jgi:hypothetical protein
MCQIENLQYKNRPVLCYKFGGFVFPGILLAHVSAILHFVLILLVVVLMRKLVFNWNQIVLFM